jgi:REP element-mobilizing transposase RayT
LDLPGQFYHVINRGIERREIFRDDLDREEFLRRLAANIAKHEIQCQAWALLPNHFHLLIRTGARGMAPFMRSLMTGYALYFNARHRRAGHLFQNRYKAKLCERDPYLLELIRYIHLNPVRAGMVAGLDALDYFAWTGHAAVMGYHPRPWQAIGDVLQEFGENTGRARAAYRDFLEAALKDAPSAPSDDFWHPASRRSASPDETTDSERSQGRILGSPAFAETVLERAEAKALLEERLRRKMDLAELTRLIAQKFELTPLSLTSRGRPADVSRAKSALIYIGTNFLGKSLQEMAVWTQMSEGAASKSRQRGQEAGDRILKELEARELVN